MPLTNATVQSAKPRPKQYKLHDEKGLFVIVRPSGGKLWRYKFRHNGIEQQLSLGIFPDVGLKEARARRDEARRQVAEGLNPAFEKKRADVAAQVSALNTFSAVAKEFIEKRRKEGVRDATHDKAEWFLKLLTPSLGSRPIAEIEPFELLAAVKKIEASGRRETARRLLAFAGRIFRYAVATTRARRDIAADLRGSLVAPQPKHHAAILDPKELGGLLRAMDGYSGQPITRAALRLSAHVFLRPGEVRAAEWSEIDLDAAVWRVPASRTKMKQEHVLPLSTQAVAILTEARTFSGEGRLVFPSVRSKDRPLSENTLNAALRRLGYTGDEMTSHGFRATASTLLNESGLWSPDAIERALAHGDRNKVRAAYHRGVHWKERVEMAQWWSDHLDTLRADGSQEG